MVADFNPLNLLKILAGLVFQIDFSFVKIAVST